MRTLSVQASRGFKIKDLKPEYRKLVPTEHKGEEYTFGTEGEADFAGDIDEAITTLGKASVYETWLKQAKTEYQNTMAVSIANKVLDPAKNKRGGSAIKITL